MSRKISKINVKREPPKHRHEKGTTEMLTQYSGSIAADHDAEGLHTGRTVGLGLAVLLAISS